MCRELTRDERKGIRKLVTEMCFGLVFTML